MLSASSNKTFLSLSLNKVRCIVKEEIMIKAKTGIYETTGVGGQQIKNVFEFLRYL